jgi:hypothetical protein
MTQRIRILSIPQMVVMLNVAFYCYAECLYAEYRYAECHGAMLVIDTKLRQCMSG